MATYVELQVTGHFSFLRGASAPEELFSAAALLGHSALGLTDWGGVPGIVRGWRGQKATGVRMIAGARVDLTGGRALLLLAQGGAIKLVAAHSAAIGRQGARWQGPLHPRLVRCRRPCRGSDRDPRP